MNTKLKKILFTLLIGSLIIAACGLVPGSEPAASTPTLAPTSAPTQVPSCDGSYGDAGKEVTVSVPSGEQRAYVYDKANGERRVVTISCVISGNTSTMTNVSDELISSAKPAATSTPVVVTTPRSGSNCRGTNDYQLKDLTEVSVEPGGYLHVEYFVSNGQPEYETVLPSGRYSVNNAFPGGHVWEYSPECSIDQVMAEVAGHINRRLDVLANNGGYVHYKKLVDEGYLSVIRITGNDVIPTALDAQTTASQPTAKATAAPKATTAPSTGGGNTGFIGRDGDADGRTIGDKQFAYIVEAWEPVSGFVVVPVGETISGLKGANWKFGSTAAALADANSKNATVYVVESGKIVQK